MKKTQRKQLFRTIHKSIVTFLSITIIVILGAAAYLGIMFSSPAILKTANRYYQEKKTYDIEVTSLKGLTTEQVNRIASLPFAEQVCGSRKTDVILSVSETENRVVRVLSLTEEMNEPTVLEGALPVKADEIALEEYFKDKDGIKLGDRVGIAGFSGESSLLCEKEFTVTAFVESPVYVTKLVTERRGSTQISDGAVKCYALVAEDAFNDEILQGGYTGAFLRLKNEKKEGTFSEGYKELLSLGKEALTALKSELSAEWVITDRYANESFNDLKMNAESVGNVGLSFSIMFIVVAALLCYSAIGRMISEQRQLIGAQKALGLTNHEIRLHYLSYAFLSTFFGLVVGLLAAIFIVQPIITIGNFSGLYIFPKYALACEWDQILIVSIASFLVTGVSAFLACNKLVKLPATELLRDDVTAMQKPILLERAKKFWSRRSLFFRVTVKNAVADKKRVFTTIFGVAGCTSLLVVGFTIKDSLASTPKLQYSNVVTYNKVLQTDSRHADPDEFSAVLKTYESEGLSFLPLSDKLTVFQIGDRYNCGHLICTSDASLSDYLNVKDIDTGESLLKDFFTENGVSKKKDGILISNRAAEEFSLKKGDSIKILDAAGEPHEAVIQGIFNNYISHIMIISEEYYETLFQSSPSESEYYIRFSADKETDQSLLQELSELTGFLTYHRADTMKTEFADTAKSLNSVLGIMIFLAAVMALVVLTNLSIMHINTKARELAIMRVNGFTEKETKIYISRDGFFLDGIGIITGILIGVVLAKIIILSVEMESVQFMRTPSYPAFAIAIFITLIFIVIVNLFSLRKLKNLKLNNVNGN